MKKNRGLAVRKRDSVKAKLDSVIAKVRSGCNDADVLLELMDLRKQFEAAEDELSSTEVQLTLPLEANSNDGH